MLSRRQVEFLALAARGMNRDQIASACCVSPWTVKDYLAAARETLDARNTAHAVAKSVALGLIVLDADGHASVAASS